MTGYFLFLLIPFLELIVPCFINIFLIVEVIERIKDFYRFWRSLVNLDRDDLFDSLFQAKLMNIHFQFVHFYLSEVKNIIHKEP